MKQLIENYINGNLSEARKRARRYSVGKIRLALIEHGYSFKKATLTAEFLKTGEGWQAACDAD